VDLFYASYNAIDIFGNVAKALLDSLDIYYSAVKAMLGKSLMSNRGSGGQELLGLRLCKENTKW
jgi:hypothetical protein